MSRNAESRFAVNPTSIDIQRSQFDRSSDVLFSGNVGDLIPFYVDSDVLPGDTFKISTSKIIRFQTMLTPIMGNLFADIYWFFVPHRLVWDHFKNFMGESENPWAQITEYHVPRLAIDDHPGVGSLADYMGIPPEVNHYAPTTDHPEAGVNALPFRAYAKVADEWFRDENLTQPLLIHTDDTTRTMNASNANDFYCELGGPVFKCAKYHDYFTSCLPSPQKSNNPVTINPAKEFVPVGAGQYVHNGSLVAGSKLYWSCLPNGENYVEMKRPSGTWPPTADTGNINAEFGPTDGTLTMYPRNLYADLRDSFNVTINDLRTAFQIQRFYEKSARGGSRYVEMLKSQFSVTSPDARLQRSEYLGGSRIPIVVKEVQNQAQTQTEYLGDVGGMSKTVDVHDDFVRSFTEHGTLLGLMVVRYPHVYSQGLEKMWSRYSMFDFYFPVFANLGETAVKRKEIYGMSNNDPQSEFLPEDVFGYNECWAEYRFKPSRTAGYMRPGVSGSLASWHLADYYNSTPFLSNSWIREEKSNVDRVLAVSSQVSHQFFCDFHISNIASRPMPVYSIPGLIDHH